jgi:hypothetical protein
MALLVTAIHDFGATPKSWMAVTSRAMTARVYFAAASCDRLPTNHGGMICFSSMM